MKAILITILFISISLITAHEAAAIQLDWSGQFWFEHNWLNNYQLSGRNSTDVDPTLIAEGGPYVPGAGEKNVTWYSAFLRLKPKVIVNDSINIKSEFNVGSPLYGFYGRGYPTTLDERFNFTGSNKEGALITAQRFWANLITDFGTIEVGRAPRHWALGALWNAGDNLFDHYQSTGDMIRLTSKFGNFSFSPALIKVSMGNNLAGASNPSDPTGASILAGNDDITDYELAAKYENPEEDFEFGLSWTHRAGNNAQSTIYFNPPRPTIGSRRIDFNMFDFYAKKKMGHYSLGLELPLFNGELGAMDGVNEFDYHAYAVIAEAAYTSDLWDISVKVGHVPGQPTGSDGDRKFKAVYLNKDYGLGLIMFHYNIYGLTNNNADDISFPNRTGINSPYDSPIVNANYLAFTPQLKLDKWTLKSAFILAYANDTARSGNRFFNYQRRQFYNSISDQDSFLGKEFDLGVSFKWDENFIIAGDAGFFFPGNYYAFTNDANTLLFDLNPMFASQIRVGITF